MGLEEICMMHMKIMKVLVMTTQFAIPALLTNIIMTENLFVSLLINNPVLFKFGLITKRMTKSLVTVLSVWLPILSLSIPSVRFMIWINWMLIKQSMVGARNGHRKDQTCQLLLRRIIIIIALIFLVHIAMIFCKDVII